MLKTEMSPCTCRKSWKVCHVATAVWISKMRCLVIALLRIALVRIPQALLTITGVRKQCSHVVFVLCFFIILVISKELCRRGQADHTYGEEHPQQVHAEDAAVYH